VLQLFQNLVFPTHPQIPAWAMDSESFPQKPVLGPEGAVAIIFSNQRSDADPEGYQAMAQRMVDLARKQPGYLGIESVRDDAGRGITVSYWKDRASALAWKAVDEHLTAQSQGQKEWYRSYVVRVSRIDAEYGPVDGQWLQAADAVGPALWARYNAWANHRMLEATARLHENHYDVEIGRKTVRGLWNHLIQTDRAWLQRLGAAHSDAAASQSQEWTETEFHSLEDIRRERTKLDQDIIEYFSGMEFQKLSSPVNYTSVIDAKSRSLDARIALFHFFNHQTFHRGQLTIVLRQLGVSSEMTDIVWMLD